jgi:hypothetical protein
MGQFWKLFSDCFCSDQEEHKHIYMYIYMYSMIHVPGAERTDVLEASTVNQHVRMSMLIVRSFTDADKCKGWLDVVCMCLYTFSQSLARLRTPVKYTLRTLIWINDLDSGGDLPCRIQTAYHLSDILWGIRFMNVSLTNKYILVWMGQLVGELANQHKQ